MNTADAVKKWSPLIQGHDISTMEMMAHVMENEARYLHNLGEEERPRVIGPFLKYIFPVLRRTVARITVLDQLTFLDQTIYVDRLTPDSGFVDFVYEVIVDETWMVFLASNSHTTSTPTETIEDLRSVVNLRHLAERTVKSIKDLYTTEEPAI
jgi:hypothetical protein